MSPSPTPLVTRRAALAGLSGMLITSALLEGCEKEAPSRLVVVLVDRSGSIHPEDWRTYQESFRSIVYSLRPRQERQEADELVLAAIGADPLSRFTLLDEGVITYEGTPDSAAQIDQGRQAMIGWLNDHVLKPAPQTRIFESLLAAQQIISREPDRAAEVVILSDMTEDSDLARFSVSLPPASGLIESLRARALLPDLRQTKVYVGCAGGDDANGYERQRQFWSAYFTAANALLVSYSRLGVALPPAEVG